MDRDRAHVAGRMRWQAYWCERLGSPLYARLLDRSAVDVEDAGPAWRVLAPHAGDPDDSMLSLRLMGAVHRLVLTGAAPELARFYRSAGGREPSARAWPAFRSVLEDHEDFLRRDIARPVQTNEVGRATALIGGFLTIARMTGMPLRLLEIGASAGLNLRWDLYRYEARGATWGDPSSPVRLCGFNTQRLPPFDVPAVVATREGCDPAPLDPASGDDRLLLTSFVWPDQHARHRLLAAALGLACRAPVNLERAGAAEWTARSLSAPARDVATVVFHSIVLQYLDADERGRFERTIHTAGRRATHRAPLAWLRMEPDGPRAAVTLTLWPDGREAVVAHAGFHGASVDWFGY